MLDQVPPPKELIISKDFHLQNRQRFLDKLRPHVVANSILLFRGEEQIQRHDDDFPPRVQQESNFFYLFGVQELSCYAVIDIDTGDTVLFTPPFAQEDKLWTVIRENEELRQVYNLSAVHHTNEIESYLKNRQPQVIYFFDGIDSDSKLRPRLANFEFLKQYKQDHEVVYDILCECRMIKSEEEISIMRHAAELSSLAHIDVLRKIRNGNTEYQIQAIFCYDTEVEGCRFLAYDCVCASGRGAATLHYHVNDQYIQEDSFVLCDMGARYYGYCSDITVTFPANGKFNEEQKIIYNAVLDAQQTVFTNIKPGVNWGDMHLLAESVIVKHLHENQVLIGDLQQINELRIGKIFLPHGLGHLLGMRAHDVGAYTKSAPPRLPELSYLRFRRNLEPGMVFTNEPGCYFIEYLLEEAYQDPIKSQFLNRPVIEKFMKVGGVRLEDDIVMTETGPVILNKVPRSIEQVEACMRGEDW